jgi:DNA polymerase-3 subunit gamma/tau
MLKTLEEAPEHVVFIFSTTEMHKIPSTIISRCQYFIFNKLNETQINETIERVVKNENIKINADAKKNLINLANGHARDVLTMLEQISMLTDKNITSDDINKIFGLISTENKIKFINLIISGDLNKTLSMFNQYYESGINVDIFFSDIVAILLDKLIHMQTKDATLLKLLNNNNINEIKVDIDNLHTLIDLLGDNMYKIKKEDNVKFYCGQLLIKAHSLFKNNKASEPVVVEKEIKVEVKKDGELPNVSEIFLTKEIKIKKPVETTNKAVTIDDVFFATLSNCNSNLLKQANEYLTKIKGSNDAKLQHFLESNKVLLSSNNSAILLFENNLDAGLLNKTFADSEFIKKIESIINKPMYFIGLTENDFKKRVSEFMSLSNKKFAELSFENPKKQNAKDIFDELLN